MLGFANESLFHTIAKIVTSRYVKMPLQSLSEGQWRLRMYSRVLHCFLITCKETCIRWRISILTWMSRDKVAWCFMTQFWTACSFVLPFFKVKCSFVNFYLGESWERKRPGREGKTLACLITFYNLIFSWRLHPIFII